MRQIYLQKEWAIPEDRRIEPGNSIDYSNLLEFQFIPEYIFGILGRR